MELHLALCGLPFRLVAAQPLKSNKPLEAGHRLAVQECLPNLPRSMSSWPLRTVVLPLDKFTDHPAAPASLERIFTDRAPDWLNKLVVSGVNPGIMNSPSQKTARKNIRKAAAAAKRKRTISLLPKRVRTALGKQGAKVAQQSR